MAKKYRLTGCAKIFLVLLVLVPAALFIAAYVTGDSPVQKISETVGTKTGPLKIKIDNPANKKDENTVKLENIIDKQEQEIQQLKKQLHECQNAKE